MFKNVHYSRKFGWFVSRWQHLQPRLSFRVPHQYTLGRHLGERTWAFQIWSFSFLITNTNRKLKCIKLFHCTGFSRSWDASQLSYLDHSYWIRTSSRANRARWKDFKCSISRSDWDSLELILLVRCRRPFLWPEIVFLHRSLLYVLHMSIFRPILESLWT